MSASGPAQIDALVDNLFRREAGRLVATLVRLLGPAQLAMAEDAVQDTLIRALDTWKYHGVPEEPVAWLHRVAKNRALDLIRHHRVAVRFAPDLSHLLETEWTLAPTIEELFAEAQLPDHELRLMFSCCDPALPADAQVAVILKLLGGFSVHEVAQALLISAAAAEKKITRAKKILTESRELFDARGAPEAGARAEAVRQALYLLFNEGYHGAHPHFTVRDELCREAIRLTDLLASTNLPDSPVTHALLALMNFHAARLAARIDGDGELLTLEEQDRSAWDARLIAKGLQHLENAATGDFSRYHLEAGIAAKHATALSFSTTDWAGIAGLYEIFALQFPSPVIALNRAIASGQAAGAHVGLALLDELVGEARLQEYPFFFAARGKFLLEMHRNREAEESFRRAHDLARSDMERNFLARRILNCQKG